MRKKWWLVLVPAVILILVLTVVFWQEICIRVAPKTVLMSAVRDTTAMLEERFREDPMGLILKNLEPEGQYTAEVALDTSYALAGDTAYALEIQTDFASNRIQAEGVVRNSGRDLNLSLYLDDTFLAISSEELVQGNFYGINYSTFASDVRGIPLLGMLVPDTKIQEWGASLQRIQRVMSQKPALPAIPDISEDDLNKLLLGILALPCEVEEGVIGLRGETDSRACHKLTYGARGAAVAEILGYLLDAQDQAEGFLNVSFYLCEGTLVKVDLHGQAGKNSLSCSVSLGVDVAAGPLALVINQNENGIYQETEVIVETQWDGMLFEETWVIRQPQKEIKVSYQWNPATGDMGLSIGDMETVLLLNLEETEDGICIRSEEFHKLLDALDPRDEARKAITGTVTISKGSGVVTPEYKNLDQWSFEDILMLLGGIGGLLGLEIG